MNNCYDNYITKKMMARRIGEPQEFLIVLVLVWKKFFSDPSKDSNNKSFLIIVIRRSDLDIDDPSFEEIFIGNDIHCAVRLCLYDIFQLVPLVCGEEVLILSRRIANLYFGRTASSGSFLS